jgi:hypothetical protein
VLALYLIFMQYIAGKFRKCEKLPEQGMYLSRSRSGNIFPYRTVVVLRHHVYVPEFHDPSCYSVPVYSSVLQTGICFSFWGIYKIQYRVRANIQVSTIGFSILKTSERR